MIEDMNQALKHSRMVREKLLADTHRPGYHFAIPEDIGIPGDPNGAFYANGRYHLMYLYACRADGFRWGHLSSIDLIHWRSHPDALLPDKFDGGIFSGGAFVDDDGIAYMAYWGLPLEGNPGGIRIARSSDPLYEKWEKYTEYALKATESGLTEIKSIDGNADYIGCSDPSNIWKKDGKYYIQAGNLPILLKFRNTGLTAPDNVRGDWVDLYESEDMVNWKYLHRFYERTSWTADDEDDMCPSFLPLPMDKNGGGMSDKYLQLFIAHNRGCQYYIGQYDDRSDLFYPEKHGRMSWVDNTYFAPEALIDDRGRHIMWAWLLDNMENELENGWSGVFGLPRLLWLNGDGELGIAPVEELKTLRYHARANDAVSLTDANRKIEVYNSLSCELQAEIDVIDAEKTGFILRCSDDFTEKTLVYYDAKNQSLVMDTTHGTVKGRPAREEAPFVLKEWEKLSLHIYIDNSVIEVFANERQAITRRVYAEKADSRSIMAFAENGRSDFGMIETWEIMSSNFY